jgi:hypothetical protein
LPDFIDRNLIKLYFLGSYTYFTYDECYNFPDDDFCLFIDFSFEQLAYLLINYGYFLSIDMYTCTMFYLLKETKYFLGHLGSNEIGSLSIDGLIDIVYEEFLTKKSHVERCSKK